MKPCDRCQALCSIRYRIQSDRTQTWQLFCPACWQKVSPANPYYRYGGTWKAKPK